MIKFKGINHLALATNDMDATLRFWRDLLGMRLVAGLGRPGHRHYFLDLGHGCRVAFFEWPEVRPLPDKDHGYPVKGPFVFDHVAFTVERREDLWGMKDRLEAAGFWVSEAMDHGFIHSIYSFDPNGVAIEFSWEVPGMDPAQRPIMADRQPCEEAMAGPEPRPERWPEPAAPTPPEDMVVYPGEGQVLADPAKNRWTR